MIKIGDTEYYARDLNRIQDEYKSTTEVPQNTDMKKLSNVETEAPKEK